MPMGQGMGARVNDLVLVQGIRDTRSTLAGWNRDPGPVLRAWLLGSLAISVLLLLAVWMIAAISHPDPTPILLPGLNEKATLGSAAHVLLRNSLVLALHAFACVAGFIAGSSLPLTASQHTGAWRLDPREGGAAGHRLRDRRHDVLAVHPGLRPGRRSLDARPPSSTSRPACSCSACSRTRSRSWSRCSSRSPRGSIASRRHEWDQLLAATFVTVAIAAPVLLVSSVVEVYVTPHLLRFLAG